jgi:hypothetical protein
LNEGTLLFNWKLRLDIRGDVSREIKFLEWPGIGVLHNQVAERIADGSYSGQQSAQLATSTLSRELVAVELLASSPSKRIWTHNLLETRLFTRLLYPRPKGAVS